MQSICSSPFFLDDQIHSPGMWLHIQTLCLPLAPGVSADAVLRELGEAIVTQATDVFGLLSPLLVVPHDDVAAARLVLRDVVAMGRGAEYAVHSNRLNVRSVRGSGSEDVACVTDSSSNPLTGDAMPVPAGTFYDDGRGIVGFCTVL